MDRTAPSAEETLRALLEAAQALLRREAFEPTARRIFEACRRLTGARAGYVALLSGDGAENELLFLEAGDAPCTVDPALPMPVRGLRAEAYRTGRAVYENDFASSEWQSLLPEGHAALDNVLFAPLRVEGAPVGVIGLANKPGPFTDEDARTAASFADLAAVALRESRTFERLERSERRYEQLFENMLEGFALHEILRDGAGRATDYRFLKTNPAFERLTGLEASAVEGRTAAEALPDLEPFWLETFAEVERTGRAAQFVQRAAPLDRTFEVTAFRPAEGLVAALFHDVSEMRKAQVAREALLRDLRKALDDVKTLRGLLPVCSYCKKVRDDRGYWKRLEAYLGEHSDAQVTHSLCPDCVEEHYGHLPPPGGPR